MQDCSNEQISRNDLQQFNENGYLIIRNLLNKDELNLLKHTFENDPNFQKYAYGRYDGADRKTKVVLWNHVGDDVTGMICRSDKVAGTMEKLLGGGVYHYHSKLIMKDANTGGMHVWHQDYGYWYQNGCLWPNMGTVFVAVDDCHQGNGCLQIIEGSHLLGRLDHQRIGDQNGISASKMDEVFQKFQPLDVPLRPGDALFFHCNVIHKSNQNRSNDRRWAFLCAYNRADNDPLKKHHHPGYVKLDKVPNTSIVSCTNKVNPETMQFFKLSDDSSVKGINEKK